MAQQYSSLAQGTLSTQDDSAQICHRLAGFDFPWELTRALELAVLKTFCVPRISHLLKATGKFTHRPQQRYDDTTLILGNILKWGYDSPQGRAAIARMNIIHQRFDILNEDFLYVLSTIVLEPIRWNRRFGWRLFTAREQHALFEFWQVVGQRMGLNSIPDTLAELEQFNHDYETQHFHYHPDNAAVGNAVIRLMQGWFPAIVAPLVPLFVKAVVDDAMCRALGWSKPNRLVQFGVIQGLKLSRRAAKWLPRRQQPSFIIDQQNTTYPNGYQIDQLGQEVYGTQAPASRCPFLKMRSFFKADF